MLLLAIFLVRSLWVGCLVFVLPQVLRPLLHQLDMSLLERLVDKLRVQPADEVIEDTVAFVRDMAEATQQVRPPPHCGGQVSERERNSYIGQTRVCALAPRIHGSGYIHTCAERLVWSPAVLSSVLAFLQPLVHVKRKESPVPEPDP